MPDGTAARAKLDVLKAILRQSGKMALSFSGGVDSAFLLKAMVDALGAANTLAVTVRAGNFPEREFREAQTLAGDLGVRHLVLDLDPLTVPGFAENTPERCYHCKKAMLSAAGDAARREGFAILADGANSDDQGDYRPGLRASRELGVASPLAEAGLTKDQIRILSRDYGLPSWNKPSFACLASRIPYGETITPEILRQVGEAEQYLLDLGFRNVRVRRHGDVARIEVDPEERGKFFADNLMDAVDGKMRSLGFLYAALDLHGYRTGSMNMGLQPALR